MRAEEKFLVLRKHRAEEGGGDREVFERERERERERGSEGERTGQKCKYRTEACDVAKICAVLKKLKEKG